MAEKVRTGGTIEKLSENVWLYTAKKSSLTRWIMLRSVRVFPSGEQADAWVIYESNPLTNLNAKAIKPKAYSNLYGACASVEELNNADS